jgi:transmembrane sensor
VSLKGEANFAVVHTPDHKKFVVLTDSLFKVEVLGTEFNVFARKRATKVGLYKGKVKVLYGPSAQQEKSMTMAPGDLITLDESRGKLAVRKVLHPENFAAWRQGRFIFENTPLTEIKSILQENYGLQVALNGPGLAEKTVSGSFKANSVNELLQALSETLDINVIRQDNHVDLTGNRQ